MLVEPGGERSFVTERGAALRLRPEDLRAGWFAGADAVHLPAYSLLEPPLGLAGMAATRLARAAGALVTVDLSSSAPLLASGRAPPCASSPRPRRTSCSPPVTRPKALVGHGRGARLAELAPVAVVKRGRKGATILVRQGAETLRFEVATRPRVKAHDTTGAGDAFDALSARLARGAAAWHRSSRGTPAGRGARQPDGPAPALQRAGGARARLTLVARRRSGAVSAAVYLAPFSQTRHERPLGGERRSAQLAPAGPGGASRRGARHEVELERPRVSGTAARTAGRVRPPRRRRDATIRWLARRTRRCRRGRRCGRTSHSARRRQARGAARSISTRKRPPGARWAAALRKQTTCSSWVVRFISVLNTGNTRPKVAAPAPGPSPCRR